MIQIDLFECTPPPTFKTAGQVAKRKPSNPADIDRGHFTQHQPLEVPIHDVDASNIPRAKDQVKRVDLPEKLGKVSGIVREIGIHLQNDVVAAKQRFLETSSIGAGKAVFLNPRIQRYFVAEDAPEFENFVCGAVG